MYGILVIVISVDVGDVNFDFKVDDYFEQVYCGIGCLVVNFVYLMWMVVGVLLVLGCLGLVGCFFVFDVG